MSLLVTSRWGISEAKLDCEFWNNFECIYIYFLYIFQLQSGDTDCEVGRNGELGSK